MTNTPSEIFSLLKLKRFDASHPAAEEAWGAGARDVITAFALALGNADPERCAALQEIIDGFPPELQAKTYTQMVEPVLSGGVHTAFHNGDLEAVEKMRAIAMAASPRIRHLFSEEVVDPGNRSTMLIDMPHPEMGPTQRRAVVAVRKYFLGSAGPEVSRLCDIGPRMMAALKLYGWETYLYGMECTDVSKDMDNILSLCREYKAEVLILDDDLLQTESPFALRQHMLLSLRAALPSIDVVSAFFDAWNVPEDKLVRAAADVDLLWAPFPSLAAWKNPQLERKVFWGPVPYGLPAMPNGEKMSSQPQFTGAVMGYNWHRAFWISAAGQAGISMTSYVTSHRPDGLDPLVSYSDYICKMATCPGLNFSMRQNLDRTYTNRTLEVLWAGSLLIQEWAPDLDYYLRPWEHYLPFETMGDFKKVLQFIHDEPGKASHIQAAGVKRAREVYGNDRIVGAIDARLQGRKKAAA